LFGLVLQKQGSLFGALTGGKNVKIIIQLLPPGSNTATSTFNNNNQVDYHHASSQPPESESIASPGTIILDHLPSWKLHKNPFWRVKHPTSSISNLHNNNSLGHPKLNKDCCYVYEASQDIAGNVILRPPAMMNHNNTNINNNSVIEHLGISVQLIGRIDMSSSINDNNNHSKPTYDFMSVSKELLPPGIIYSHQETILSFKFKNMDKELESYTGRMVAVRYVVRVRFFVVFFCQSKFSLAVD
jgi:hypothetical protein